MLKKYYNTDKSFNTFAVSELKFLKNYYWEVLYEKLLVNFLSK